MNDQSSPAPLTSQFPVAPVAHCAGRAFLDGHARLVSGSADKRVLLWTLGDAAATPTELVSGHAGKVNAVLPCGNVVAVAGTQRDLVLANLA